MAETQVNPLAAAMQAAMAQAMAQAMPAMLAQMLGMAAPAAPAAPPAPMPVKPMGVVTPTVGFLGISIPDVTGDKTGTLPVSIELPDGTTIRNLWVKGANFASGNIGYRIGGGAKVRAEGKVTGYRWTFNASLVLSQTAGDGSKSTDPDAATA